MQVVGADHEMAVPSWITIGVFDGVHSGHRQLMGQVVARARSADASSVVVTFDPNPLEVLRPDVAPVRISTLEHRLELIADQGVDVCMVIPFTHEESQIPAEQFAQDVLFGQLHATGIVIGQNFRFGRRASGDVELLRTLATSRGVHVEGVDLVNSGNEAVSSSRIRALIADGDVAGANALLGRWHCVDGVVIRGHRRGRDLGYPTVNLDVAERAAIPADGVYAGCTTIAGGPVRAAISIGTNPTFDGQARTVEAYLLDFDGDLYDQPLRLEFGERLRETTRFDSVLALLEQMAIDVEQTRITPLP